MRASLCQKVLDYQQEDDSTYVYCQVVKLLDDEEKLKLTWHLQA
ncbi:MAG: hypothetical protein R2865_14635 [Deinococcales bacterium]